MRVQMGNSISDTLIGDVPYPDFRSRALAQRAHAQAGSVPFTMITLYQFWSHYLTGQFDSVLHAEFRKCALADLVQNPPLNVGAQHLIAFYEASLDREESPLDNVNELLADVRRLLDSAIDADRVCVD